MSQPLAHPGPRDVFNLARKYAELLRAIYTHPEFKYFETPTAAWQPIDTKNTPTPLLMVSNSVQTTYIEYIIPFLPAGATRKTREISNPWAYADPAYEWEWEWDEERGELRSKADGQAQPFPDLGAAGTEKRGDVVLRSMIACKCICENATDPKAKLIIGGESFDFGEDANRLATELAGM